MLEKTSSEKAKAKPPAIKLPKTKKPPASVLKAVVKRAESKSGLAKLPPKTPETQESAAEPVKAAKKKGYWARRKDAVYLKAAKDLCAKYFVDGGSVLDVGSNRTPTLEWHRARASRLVSVDLRNPYRGSGVEAIAGNFFDFDDSKPFDMVTCFQVLEHVPDAHAFAQKLLSTGKIVVVSVPYKWPKGKCKWHIHDPVDEVKMMGWFGQAPIEAFIAVESDVSSDRLIQVYRKEVAKQPAGWRSKLAGTLSKLADSLNKQ
jgi:hypothetical protein